MYELIYCSVAKQALTDEDIADILEKSRDYNSKNDVTGCLLFHNNEFIQILEGDKKTLKDLFQKIEQDPRHNYVMLVAENEIEKRIFSNWSMAYHKIENDDAVNVDKLLFVNNFITLSELISKPTHASRVFWYMAKQLLQE
jgi:hypothetical protein